MPLRYPEGSGGHVPYLGVGSVCRKYLGYGTEPEARERLQRVILPLDHHLGFTSGSVRHGSGERDRTLPA